MPRLWILAFAVTGSSQGQRRLACSGLVSKRHRNLALLRKPWTRSYLGWVSRKKNMLSVPTSRPPARSEEHTSELQSRGHLVCRLLLEKKKKKKKKRNQVIRKQEKLDS